MRVFIMLTICLFSYFSLSAQNIYIAVRINDNNIDKKYEQVVEDVFQDSFARLNYNVRVSRNLGDFAAERDEEINYQRNGAVSSEKVIMDGDEMPVSQLCVISVEKLQSTYYFRAKVFDIKSKKLYKTASYFGDNGMGITDITNIGRLRAIAWELIARLGYENKDKAKAISEHIRNRLDSIDTRQKNKRRGIIRSNNGKALAYSLIPGVGLMMKGHKAEGAVYMVGDIALIGGGLAFMANANKQKDIMNNHSTGIDQYKSAEKKYNRSKTAAYCCFGTAAGLYIVNLVRGYVAEPKPGARLQWAVVPSAASTMYGEPNMSVNLALSYKF